MLTHDSRVIVVTVHCSRCKIVESFEGKGAEGKANALAELHNRDDHKTWTKRDVK